MYIRDGRLRGFFVGKTDAIKTPPCCHPPSSSVFIFICPDEQLVSQLVLKASLLTGTGKQQTLGCHSRRWCFVVRGMHHAYRRHHNYHIRQSLTSRLTADHSLPPLFTNTARAQSNRGKEFLLTCFFFFSAVVRVKSRWEHVQRRMWGRACRLRDDGICFVRHLFVV